MSKREEIARAIGDALGQSVSWFTCIRLASIALAALEEPTDRMLEAGEGPIPTWSMKKEHAAVVWRAMIAAAKEG